MADITKIMGIGLAAENVPPFDGWVQHFHGMSGFEDESWNEGTQSFVGVYFFLEINESATWQIGYRPTKCRITFTDLHEDSYLYIYDGTWIAQLTPPIVLADPGDDFVEFNLDFSSEDDMVLIEVYNFGSITNIEFYEW